MWGISWIAERLSASEGGLCATELVKNNLILLTPLWYTSPRVLSGEIRSMSEVNEWSGEVFFFVLPSSSPASWLRCGVPEATLSVDAEVLDGLHAGTLPFFSAWNYIKMHIFMSNTANNWDCNVQVMTSYGLLSGYHILGHLQGCSGQGCGQVTQAW
jgi:hypothetical protein